MSSPIFSKVFVVYLVGSSFFRSWVIGLVFLLVMGLRYLLCRFSEVLGLRFLYIPSFWNIGNQRRAI
jgi:hypothetical protein